MKLRVAGLAICLLAGCGGAGDRAKLSVIQSEIFTPKCATAGCHSGTAPEAGLDLTSGKSHAELVGVDAEKAPGEKRVAAGDVSASVLSKVIVNPYKAITRMPNGSVKLAQVDIDAINTWIANGAADD